jgi:hypothetical protein
VEELTAVRALYEKCGEVLEGSRELKRLPQAILNLDLSEFVAFLLLVGRAAVRDRTAWRTNGAYRYDPDKTHRILAAGFEIATQWPGSFIELLGELHTKSRRKKHHIGLGPDVARMFRMFANRDSLPFLEVVKSAIREYVTQHQVFLQDRTKRMLGYRAKESMDFVSAVEAGKILGRSKETARKLAIANGWCDGAPGPGRILRIERRKVEEWRDTESTMTIAAVGRNLGLWPAAAADLFNCGILHCVLGPKCWHGKDTGRHLVRKSAVDRIRRIIEGPISKDIHSDAAGLVSWRNFRTRQCAQGLNAGVALQAMLDGRLVARARDQRHKGFRALLFGVVDLHQCASSTSHATGGDQREPMFSVRDAERVFGFTTANIVGALDLRLLHADKTRGARSARLIGMSDLEAFSKRYTTIGRLAKDHGVHANVVRIVLNELRVKPAVAGKGAYGVYAIYSKVDLKHSRFSSAIESTKRA